jgi:membrane protein required for colicin V production
MNILDWIIIGVLLFYLVSGFRAGFILKIGSLLGLILGIIIAGRNYQTVSGWFGGSILWDIAAFILIMVLVSVIVGFVAMVVNKIYNFAAIIPGFKLVNRLGGAIVGVIEGSIFLGIILVLLVGIWNPEQGSIQKLYQESKLHGPIVSFGKWFGGLLPDAVRPSNVDFDRILNSGATDEIQKQIEELR